MSAAGCATEDEWLATEPVAAKAAIDARDAAQVELDTANAALNAAQAEYSAAQTAVAPAKAALDTANAQLASAQAAYDTSSAALAAARTQLDTAKAQITEAEPQIAEGEKQLADGQQQLAAAKKQVLEAEKQIASGETALSLAPGLAQLQLELAQSKLDSAKAQYEDGLAQLEDGKAELEDGEAEYEKQKKDVEQQLADAEAEIADGEQKLAELEVPEWMILDRTSHVSASSYLSNVDKLEAITTVFPIFFFLVAALVALTTMTRMVEEERLQIGTLKALGYKRGQIMFKYLFYAWVATLVGGAAGLAFGFTVIPIVIWNAYGTMYTIPGFRCLFHASLAVLGVGAALLCTSAATLNACGQTLKEWAAQLLLPKAPKAGKRIFLERITPVWKRMKFTHKVTARNLFRYKKRFFMTVIGVAGCTALLVTGFGLKDSISDIVSKQFGKVFTYDFLVTLSKESALKDAGFQALMDAPEQVTSYLPVQQERISLDVDGQSYDVYLFVPEDEARLDNFIDLHERKSGAAVPLTDGPGGGLHAGGVGDGEAGEDLRLGNVGRQYRGQRQQLRGQGLDGVVPQELCAGGGHHDGVHHHPLRAVLPELFRDDGNQLRRGDHADLHRVGDDIREYGVQLLRQEMGRGLQDVCDAGGVLGRQGRDRAGGEYAVGGHGFDIGLNPGASAGIASGNGQCCFHAHFSFRCKHSTVL